MILRVFVIEVECGLITKQFLNKFERPKPTTNVQKNNLFSGFSFRNNLEWVKSLHQKNIQQNPIDIHYKQHFVNFIDNLTHIING
jgi:hypothetical protein